MLSATDHAREVERRVVAIHTKAVDTCGFLEARDGYLYEPGFCKFKK